MASMNEKDYYAILGVSKDATKEEIRRAFQKKARTLHPDINKEPDAEEKFKEVSEAYAVLSDEAKRARYDSMRSGNPFGGYASPYGGSSAGGYSGGYTGGGDPFDGFPFGWGFPFADMLGGASHRARSRAFNPRAGSDLNYSVELTAEEAKRGTKRAVVYQRYVACESCHGHGSVEADHPVTCPTCGGSGNIELDLTGMLGFGVMQMKCPECEGTGKVVADPCGQCGGSGRVMSASETVIDIPAGSHDGDEVRVAGMGNAGTNGSGPGDLVCEIGVASERLTRRQAMGFQILGFDVPFVVLGLIAGVLYSMRIFVGMLALVGLFMVVRDGVRGEKRWWQNASRHLVSGMQSGVFLALLMTSMYSCGARTAARW